MAVTERGGRWSGLKEMGSVLMKEGMVMFSHEELEGLLFRRNGYVLS